MIIQVDDLARSFGSIEAVRGVTFGVEAGEIFGFLGPNGAGKTTTINMLCTLLKPSRGSARVDGHDVTRDRAEVRRAIGLVFQQTTLDEYLSADQNLRFHAYAYGLPRDVRERRMTELMAMVDLADRRSGSVRTYSGGMKRRLEIARGLLHHPKVLFLDEPTLGLDPQTRRHIWDYLLRLRDQEGLTIFLTTHYMDEAEHADRIAVIDHGQIVGLDTPDGLKRAVGGDTIKITTPDNSAAAAEVHTRYGVEPAVLNGTVDFVVPQGDQFLPALIRDFSQPIQAVELHRPTLDDVFLSLTGREIRDEGLDEQQMMVNDMARRWGR
ncbi:MAG: ATP-binding cassette domain-containing protein [Candidatus Limnocylindrales bacterium]